MFTMSIGTAGEDSKGAYGVDVSYCQNPDDLDWEGSDRDAINWVYIKGSNGGTLDSQCLKHVARVRDASISLGLYHYVNETAGQVQLATFRNVLQQAKIRGDDLVPCLDLEWIPCRDANNQPSGRLPYDMPAYKKTIDLMIDELTAQYGGVLIYSNGGYFEQCGKPQSWLACPWWVADYRKIPEPYMPYKKWSMWQYGVKNTEWNGDLKLDRNIARELPYIVET
jgi:GH25 family lysozyme M1 (1,4-beta-N-acetylmuramidase)